MTSDQLRRFAELQNKLTDLFLTEADPDSFPENDVPLAKQSREARGDTFWMKKTAAATMTLMLRVQNYVDERESRMGRRDTEVDIEKEHARSTREASKFIDEMRSRLQKDRAVS